MCIFSDFVPYWKSSGQILRWIFNFWDPQTPHDENLPNQHASDRMSPKGSLFQSTIPCWELLREKGDIWRTWFGFCSKKLTNKLQTSGNLAWIWVYWSYPIQDFSWCRVGFTGGGVTIGILETAWDIKISSI